MNTSATSKRHPRLLALTLFAVLGSGSAGGVFFAFSSFIMKALSRIPSEAGIAAMQSINVSVINLSFAIQLFGTSAVCIALGAWALLHWQAAGSRYLLVGSLLYLASMGTTFGFNVPLNDALANLHPADASAARYWEFFVPRWTAWNHIRTVGCLAAAASFTLAILQFGRARS